MPARVLPVPVAWALLASCSSEPNLYTGVGLEIRAPLTQPVTRTRLSCDPFLVCDSPYTAYRMVDADRWYVHLLVVKDEPSSALGITLAFEAGRLVEALGSTVGLKGPVTLASTSDTGREVEVHALAGGWIRVDERHLFDPERFGAEIELDYPSGAILRGTITPLDNDRADAGPPDAAP